MASTIGLQVKDAGSNAVLVRFHNCCPWLDPLTGYVHSNFPSHKIDFENVTNLLLTVTNLFCLVPFIWQVFSRSNYDGSTDSEAAGLHRKCTGLSRLEHETCVQWCRRIDSIYHYLKQKSNPWNCTTSERGKQGWEDHKVLNDACFKWVQNSWGEDWQNKIDPAIFCIVTCQMTKKLFISWGFKIKEKHNSSTFSWIWKSVKSEKFVNQKWQQSSPRKFLEKYRDI